MAEYKTKTPKKISPRYLENAALYYLQRFSSSSANLQKVLMRKVDKSLRHHGEPDREEAAAWVAQVAEKMKGLGYVDDAAYAQTKVRAFHRQGRSARATRQALAAKGVPADLTAEALKALSEEETLTDPDLAAAATLARKRRFGPYRPEEERQERFDKDLAALGRAGFDYETARKVLEADSVEDLEDMI